MNTGSDGNATNDVVPAASPEIKPRVVAWLGVMPRAAKWGVVARDSMRIRGSCVIIARARDGG